MKDLCAEFILFVRRIACSNEVRFYDDIILNTGELGPLSIRKKIKCKCLVVMPP